MDDTAFHAWSRPSIPGDHDVAGGTRRRVQFTMTGEILTVATGAVEPVHEHVVVEFPGPGDVAGLAHNAIRRVSPPNGSGDAEGEFCAYVDLVAADLPWRYTSQVVGGHDALPPWLAVIAGEEGTELGLDLAGRAWVSAAVTAQLDPRRAGAWAHVHNHHPSGRLEAARVLCPRELPDDAACLAVVVPLFRPDPAAPGGIAHSWRAGAFQGGLPVLHSWRFHTNEAGTFLDLVAALKPGPIPEGLGVATIVVDTSAGDRATASAFGLLAPIGVSSAGGWSDPGVADDTATRLAPPAQAGVPPVVGPPHYGRPWVTDPEATAWGRELNHDPRHRAVAALGTRAAIDWQQEIVDAASQRLGQTHLAAAMLGHLTTGVELTTRLRRRQPGGAGSVMDQRTAADRLAFYGPALRKVFAADGGSVLAALTGPSSPLSPAVLSAAALRLARPGAPLVRRRPTDGQGWSPGGLVEHLNTCRYPPEATLPTTEPGPDSNLANALEEYLAATDDTSEVSTFDWAEQDLRGWEVDLDDDSPCRSIDLVDVVGALDAAFDPVNVPVEAVLGRIRPRPARHDVPWVVAPDLDLPAWAWLRDHAPEWLLPRAALIAPDTIVALRTNGAFLEAFLVGLSQQAVAELRWRGVPCAPTSMPMRTMWQRVRDPDDDKIRPDISVVDTWHTSHGLDHASHRNGDGDMLVILLRSDLLRRYPDTVIRLARRRAATPTEPDLDAPGVVPAAVGAIAAGLWFIAFDVDPDALGDHFLLLEETIDAPRFTTPVGTVPGEPSGYRVRSPDGVVAEAFNGAEFAAGAWARPVRAAIDGQRLVSPPPVIGGP